MTAPPLTLRLAHTADWHGGFRQFERSENGQNIRERDVAHAIERTVDGILAAKPDLVVLAGDVHHSVRPPNGAVLRTFTQLHRLRQGLPNAPVVLVSGDHDSPRSSDQGSILPLFKSIGVHVIEGGEPQVVDLGSCVVTAVPKWACRKLPPAPIDGRLHILVAHGEARKVGGLEPELNPALFEGYAYCALGHWHVCQEMAPNAWYSGAVDYTSSDPWSELREQAKRGLPGKGFLLVELTPGQPPVVTFQPIEAPRRFVDVDPIDATGLAVADLNALLDARLSTVPDASVARLIVDGVRREMRPFVDYPMLRRHKARLLHLTLELRRPADQAATPAARAAVFKRLDQVVESFLQARELPPDLERAEFVRLGLEHFAGPA